MSEDALIPDRRHELADHSYRMLQYTWFRVIGKLPELAFPHYVGRGLGLSPKYNIRDVWQAPMHEHVVVKFSLSPGGAIIPRTNQQGRLVKPGEAILRFVEDDSDFWEGYHAAFRGKWEFIGLIISGRIAVQTARVLIEEFGRIYPVGLDHPIIRQASQYAAEPNHITEMTGANASRFCNDVFGALLDAAESSAADRAGRFVNRADAIEATMRQDLKRDWSVEELADRHGISREHLTRLFTRRFGIPPRRYLVELRMQEACRLLRTTQDSIKSVVTRLGFQNHANFVRAFRRLNGVAPTEYRSRRFESPGTAPSKK
ncbi:MAG TPA: AraC family transcriptional regulator [Tepidisphaeraceae bacterium]|nr:AraC family transcriptional regulator [Tepidisphaeraceae bacterium]